MVDPGQLRERITIQAPSVAREGYGGESITWTDIATIWAAVWPKSGREYFTVQQFQSEITIQIRIRWRTDINPGWRIKHGNLYYDVRYKIPVQYQRDMIDLMCTEAQT